MNDVFILLLSAGGPGALSFALVVLGLLSKRLGTVTKMPPYYRWFYVGAGLLGVSGLSRLLSIADSIESLPLLYTASFALGVTVSLIVAWHYWSWLFAERDT